MNALEDKHGKRPHQENTAFRRGEKENGCGEDVAFGRGEMENLYGECVLGERNISKTMGRSLAVKQADLMDCIAVGKKEEFFLWWRMQHCKLEFGSLL